MSCPYVGCLSVVACAFCGVSEYGAYCGEVADMDCMDSALDKVRDLEYVQCDLHHSGLTALETWLGD